MGYDVDTIFQIAGIGIVVAMIHTVLKQMGKEDWAHWVTLIGFIVVLYMVATIVDDLFTKIRSVFLFIGS
ncbi:MULTISPECIES: stage III sporulation protein AC [Geomicrobium]|uniref:Stage III sporulation protein AC n=1 Tax=Geomicrobium sediminis TaxID=1347788 RepID=A0ABS2PE94_9BACL|nr:MULTISPECIES: stage III sporulation protein AC [unclassified Geomicrobium]EZH67725.1 stage III sporulation protein AC [Bacillaceae bacterium JMAK1]MBM7633656.1 stage III sporulation protein AC [Geomicrobium sediminis]GAJ98621.1 stage III sporulation protein AC [Geomicrobium sp. JCM 19055]GAK06532.1 stage III sporulation protein AC [Geomicrobium sp. JCM 19038]